MTPVYKDTITEDALIATIVAMKHQIGILHCGASGIATAFNVVMESSVSSQKYEVILNSPLRQEYFILFPHQSQE